MAQAAMILQGAGSLFNAMGAIREGAQADKTAEFNADQVREAANIKAEQIKEESRRILATQRARYGASGVTMEGSPLLVQLESARNAKLDEMMVRYSGEKQARIMDWEGKQAKTASYWKAGNSILTGASGMMNQYSKSQVDAKQFESTKIMAKLIMIGMTRITGGQSGNTEGKQHENTHH